MNQHAPPLDLAALAIFRAVAQEGSVTRAAERLQRVQSNVTTRVRQLEADVSATLFLREGKRMALTAEGELLLGYADRLLALAEEARQALRPGEPGGRLRLGSMESTAASRLPAPLARLHQQWPAVALDLSTGPTQELLERLRAHALDAAFVAWPPGQPPDAALDTRPVFTEELLLALPPGHPARRIFSGVHAQDLLRPHAGLSHAQGALARSDWRQGRRGGTRQHHRCAGATEITRGQGHDPDAAGSGPHIACQRCRQPAVPGRLSGSRCAMGERAGAAQRGKHALGRSAQKRQVDGREWAMR